MKLIICILFLAFFHSSAVNAEVQPVPSVDLGQYQGKWYEIASIPQFFQRNCAANTNAIYSMSEDGMLKVMNSCDSRSGEKITSEGRAKIIDAVSNAKLKVTFVRLFDWIFTFGGNYWILDLAPDYSFAVVGDNSLKYLWILSREPVLPQNTLVNIENRLRTMGFDTCAILTSIQSGGNNQRRPLCESVK